MNEEQFWKIIEQFDWEQEGEDEAVIEPAFNTLVSLGEKEIIEFEEILAKKLYELDRRDIAKACYNVDDKHFSGDDFLYSRCVVVANGKEIFDEVISNPDEMPSEMEFESLLYLGPRAYEELTGEELVQVTKYSYETLSNTEGWKAS